MKLIISRHAKSSWETHHQDHNRPLSPRGIKAAGKIGKWLAQNNHQPKGVLCSTATRNRMTWKLMSEHLNEPLSINYCSAIYGGTTGDLLHHLKAEEFDPVIILGHNPTIASFAGNILRQRPHSLEFSHFPTCATVVCELNISSWQDCEFGKANLIDFVVPRNL